MTAKSKKRSKLSYPASKPNLQHSAVIDQINNSTASSGPKSTAAKEKQVAANPWSVVVRNEKLACVLQSEFSRGPTEVQRQFLVQTGAKSKKSTGSSGEGDDSDGAGVLCASKTVILTFGSVWLTLKHLTIAILY